MRILYHHRTLGEDAEGIHIESMVRAFLSLGHEVRVQSLISTGVGAPQERERRLGRLVKRLPQGLYEMAEVAYNARGYQDVRRVIRSYRPDLVYDRYNLYSFCAVSAARRSGVPVFLEVNTPYAYQRRIYEKLAFSRFAPWMERRTWQKADQVLVVSTPLKGYLVEVGVPPERIEVIPNGVDLDLFNPRADSKESSPRGPAGADGTIRVGFVGSLRRWHGVDLLLEAMAPVLRPGGRVRLLIAGDGPERRGLEERAGGLGIGGCVEFLGAVGHDRIPDVVARFDIGVSPRSVFYQSPMKILEYMAMEKPVVASDSGNVRDLVDDGVEGLLFRSEDAGTMREAIDRLARDPELRARLGRRGRERVERRHTWLGNARRVLELLHARQRSGLGRGGAWSSA